MKIDANKIKEIRDLIFPVLESQHVDLVDLEFKGSTGTQVLRIFVDIDGGISLDQCVYLSREISNLLDTKDIIAGRYRLEVSSPGLDRPLKTGRDFQRNLRRTVTIIFLADNGQYQTTTGTIEQVDGDVVVIKQNNHRISIDISKISVAKIIPIW